MDNLSRLKALGFVPAELLLPNGEIDRWAVIACDQYSSQPDYWQRAEELVGSAPSTLRLILPEAFLEVPDVAERQRRCVEAMRAYLDGGVFRTVPQCFVYVERSTVHGGLRRGLVGAIDLEQYDYTPGTKKPVRATEGTILKRLPPRIEVRRQASLECPHIMVLIDDPGCTVIEPLEAQKGGMEQLYSGELMLGGGSIQGWRAAEAQWGGIAGALEALYRRGGMVFAVGDGNHSLATAKACWEELKPGLSAVEKETHPARYALVELVNVHDHGLQFHPIHRVVFGADDAVLLGTVLWQMNKRGWQATLGEGQDGQSIEYVCEGGRGFIHIANPEHLMPVGSLQEVLDSFISENPEASLDYVHGDDTAEELGLKPGNMAFLLPVLDKGSLFPVVEQLGVLPRKAFSIGEADEKRFYMECRRIIE